MTLIEYLVLLFFFLFFTLIPEGTVLYGLLAVVIVALSNEVIKRS